MHSFNPRFSAALVLLGALAAQDASADEVTYEKVRTAVAGIDKLADQTLQKTGVPGMAIVVVYKDQVLYLKGFGVRRASAGDLVDADTVFQLASVSKPIASTVLAALVGAGVIDWDDRIIDHNPDFRLYDPWVTREVRLRDLLCHRSGLPAFAGDLLEDLGYDRAEVLRRLRYVKPASGFRAQFAYANFGYTAAAVAGARAAGKSWEDLAADSLYRRLGMNSTSSRFADYAAAKNRALLHVRVDGKWVAKYVRNPDAQSPAGGVSSTARDLARWMRLQLGDGKFEGKQLIAAKALDETHRPQIVSGFNPQTKRAFFYALGWNVNYDDRGRIFLKHSGAFSLGARTEVALLPAEQIGFAVLTNAGPTGVPEGITESFFELLLKGRLEKDWVELANRLFEEEVKKMTGYETDYSKPPEPKSPPLPTDAYVGAYRNDYFGDIEVIQAGGGVGLRMGPKKISFSLQHWDRDTFIYQPAGESAGGLSGVTFWIGPNRKAKSVSIENLDIHGQGTFTRERGQ
jgi:CubicO group peptidase (beta-lactamase class C family)